MNIYREEDIQAITDNLDQIMEESILVRNTLLEPTLEEYNQAKQVVKDFIKHKKRIVYGGFALNTLIKDKQPKDQIYKEHARSDIEFYTPEPIQDLIELCDLFHEKKFPYVRGTEAQHEETYTIFVNFEQICDFSYMPKNVYGNMPVRKIDGILYPHQSWILVDMFRQYNDPILSYRRLRDKTFFRTNALLKHYPLNLSTDSSFKKNTEHTGFKEQIFNVVSNMDTIIFTGSVAIQYYLTLENTIRYNNMELFSLNFKEDIKNIYKDIQKILGDKASELEINMYRPFFQFWDDHIEFILNGTCLLKVYGSNGICLPYNNLYVNNLKIEKLQTGGFYKDIKEGGSSKPLKIATFILMFNHVLIHRQYHFVNRSDTYKKYEKLMKQLLDKRSSYLKAKSITVIDNSPYREFIVRCTGKTIDTVRQFRLNADDKRAAKRYPFSYVPTNVKEGFKAPDMMFKNTSGNIYKNGPQKMLED